ncbi:MAG: CARDB domain-containing protein [archaeon]
MESKQIWTVIGVAFVVALLTAIVVVKTVPNPMASPRITVSGAGNQTGIGGTPFGPDLIITGLNSTGYCNGTGSTPCAINVDITVTNMGNAASTPSATCSVIRTGTIYNTFCIGNVGLGPSQSHTIHGTHGSFPTGNYTYYGIADFLGQVFETNENNNVASTPMELRF